MPTVGSGFSPGDTVIWSGPNPDVMDGTGFSPVLLIQNPGTVMATSPATVIVWADGASTSSFSPTDPALVWVTAS